MSAPNTKFIVVNAQNGPSRSPFVHNSLASAQAEAVRLSSETPGVKFYVLATLGYMQTKAGEWNPNHHGFGLNTKDMRDGMFHDCIESVRNAQDSDDGIPF